MNYMAIGNNALQNEHGNSPGESSEQLTFSDSEFDDVRAAIKEHTGISMGDSKRQLIYRRLAGRLKTRNCNSFNDYLALLKSGDRDELEYFSNAVTTNVTSFFREGHHFQYLMKTIVPSVVEKNRDSNKRLRVWSAGCSSGEEPYSLAMSLYDAIPDISQWDARILATDLDTDVLNFARAGKYTKQRVKDIPETKLTQWFDENAEDDERFYQANNKLKKLITFNQLNLMGAWPMKGPFDVIFCRNVIIYFDKPTQRVLVDRYAELLSDNGYLLLGHSESLLNVTDRFELVDKTTYQKKY